MLSELLKRTFQHNQKSYLFFLSQGQVSSLLELPFDPQATVKFVQKFETDFSRNIELNQCEGESID